MPIIAQAAKKLRHDRKRKRQNDRSRKLLSQAVKGARKAPSPKTLSLAFAALDKATKTHLIHKNKASRLKSRLSKLIATR